MAGALVEVRSRGGRPTRRHRVLVPADGSVYALPAPPAQCGAVARTGWVVDPRWPAAECALCFDAPVPDVQDEPDPTGPFSLEVWQQRHWRLVTGVDSGRMYDRETGALEAARLLARRLFTCVRVLRRDGTVLACFTASGGRTLP